jgi:hypothetical protein
MAVSAVLLPPLAFAQAAEAKPAAGAGVTPAEVVDALDLAVPLIAEAMPAASTDDADDAMIADDSGAYVEAPRDAARNVVIRPGDASGRSPSFSVRDIEVDDPQTFVARSPSEPEPTIGSASPEAVRDTPVIPRLRDDDTIGIAIPGGAHGRNGVQVKPGLTVYQGTDTSTSQAVQSSGDGAIRFLTVIGGPQAPTEFRFDLTLADGATAELQPDGSLIIQGSTSVDGTREPIVRIAAPWAVDARQNRLPVHFTVEGHVIVLHVAHTGAAYPVVADPELFFFHRFSPASPGASGGSLSGASVGLFEAQVDYRNMSRLTMQWSFRLSYRQQQACSYHRVSEFARAAVFGRMTRYQDGHPNESCDYRFHSSMSKYTYADDRFLPTTHYLRGRIGMPLSLWVSLQFQVGPRTVRQIHVYADYIL